MNWNGVIFTPDGEGSAVKNEYQTQYAIGL
jgi:hypothetical protein